MSLQRLVLFEIADRRELGCVTGERHRPLMPVRDRKGLGKYLSFFVAHVNGHQGAREILGDHFLIAVSDAEIGLAVDDR